MIGLRAINAFIIILISTLREATPDLNASQDWVPYVSIIIKIVTIFQDFILYSMYVKLLFWFYFKKVIKLKSSEAFAFDLLIVRLFMAWISILSSFYIVDDLLRQLISIAFSYSILGKNTE